METPHVEHAFDTPEPVRLHIENGSGSVRVAAADVVTTKIDITGRRAEEVVVDQQGPTVTVVAPKGRGGLFGGENRLDIEVTVPTGSDLHAKTGSADVTVTGTVAATRVKSGSGEVTLERVTGVGVVDSGSGDITLQEAAAELRLRSGSGAIRLGSAAATAAISTGSGDVRVGHSSGPIVVKTGSGDLGVDDADTDVTLVTGSGSLVVGSARQGKVSLKGASGDLRVGIPVGTPVWTDIRTATGRVSSRIESVGEPEPGAPYVEVRATTASGNVDLVPA